MKPLRIIMALALLVLAVAIRFGLSLVLTPADPFSMAVVSPGGAS